MSVIRVGSTSTYADGWETIFGRATGGARRPKKARKKSAAKVAKKKVAKKAAKKRAKKAGRRR
jgi:hypothetical protein